MIVYMNNCLGRDYEKLYGKGALYDLETKGRQAEKAKNLSAGDKCIVATKTKDEHIAFSWFSFLHEENKLDTERGVHCRVLYGKFIKSDTYSKRDAAHTEPYSKFFDINGNFKRQSVIICDA